MKKEKIAIQLSRKALYSIITFLLIIIIGMGVFAFGTSSPSTFGHSAGELDFSSGVPGNAIFNDNVGIGVLNPQAKLDINGEFKVNSTNIACDTTTEGSIRYNSVSNVMEFCDGSTWAEL